MIDSSDELTTAAQGRLEHARAEFGAEVIYLNTASMGLPPRRSLDALRSTLGSWRSGTAEPSDYDPPLAAARASYARMVGVEASSVAVGSQVSVFAGLVAASLPSNSEVLTAVGDFTSILFPFHVQERRGITVREVPLEHLAAEVTSRTALVSISAVQSANGRVADLDALAAACAATGARVLLDTTQAVGWLPVDAGRFAYTVCAGYKWLLAPRGTAYFTVQPDLRDDLFPHTAGWYAGHEPWASIYGTPLRLAPDARRFDVSPVWHAWVGAAPALDLLTGIGSGALNAHAVGLAERFCAAVGLPPAGSAIVSAVADDDVPRLMAEARIVGSVRAERLRLAFHVSTSEDDADRAAEVLRGHLRR